MCGRQTVSNGSGGLPELSPSFFGIEEIALVQRRACCVTRTKLARFYAQGAIQLELQDVSDEVSETRNKEKSRAEEYVAYHSCVIH